MAVRQMRIDSDPQKFLYEAHTRLKHSLLGNYIAGWGRIMGSQQTWGTPRRLVLIDGFAGRGEHYDPDTLEPVPDSGSPGRMIRVASNLLQHQNASEAVCAFIEGTPANHTRLSQIVLAAKEEHPSVRVIPPYAGVFADKIDEVIRDTKAKQAGAAPFFFIDPFGFSDTPMGTMRRILSIPKAELFITYIYRDANRFFEVENRQRAYEGLYGAPHNEIPDDPHDRREFYIEQLCRGLEAYPSIFRVSSDERLDTVYYLIHICQHPRGRRLMKEVMFKQSGAGQGDEFAYLGPNDYQRYQGRFFQDETDETLAQLLLQRFRGQTLSFSAIQDQTCMDTQMVQANYRSVIRGLEAGTKQVTIQRIESKSYGIAGRDEITFLNSLL